MKELLKSLENMRIEVENMENTSFTNGYLMGIDHAIFLTKLQLNSELEK